MVNPQGQPYCGFCAKYPQKSGPSAADFVNTAEEERIADVLFRYGEERQSRRVARAIVAAIRAASSLSVEATARNGRAFVDAYALRGAATAIDAAGLGCAGR